MAPFACLKVWLVRLVFSAGTVFFSHNNSAGTVFFSQFQPKFRPANGAIKNARNQKSNPQIHVPKNSKPNRLECLIFALYCK